MMEVADNIAKSYSISVFDVLNENADNVIAVINHLIEKADNEKPQSKSKPQTTKNGVRRVLVNEKTATNGWY